MSSRIRSNFAVSHGTGPWHPSGKLVELLPMGSPSQDRDAGSNAAGATNLVFVDSSANAFRPRPLGHVSGSTPNS